jgi:hypothetical protein
MELAQPMGNAWLTIWTEPRKTIRNIVDTNPRYHVLLLIVLGTELGLLAGLAARPPALPGNMTAENAATVQQYLRIGGIAMIVIAPLFAIVSLYIGGAVLRWAGELIGGVATSVQVRAAIAWSTIPSIGAAVINLVAVGTGVIKIAPPPQKFEGFGTVLAQLNGAELIAAAIGIWGAVIWFKCLGEVHRFSAWKALAASIITVALALLAMAAVGMGLLIAALMFAHRT